MLKRFLGKTGVPEETVEVVKDETINIYRRTLDSSWMDGFRNRVILSEMSKILRVVHKVVRDAKSLLRVQSR